MKRFKLIALLCMLGFFFVSCEDESKNEWENYYGFTNTDVIGTYSFSNVSDAFDGVEGTGRHACYDAEVSIQASSENPDMLRFTVNCPREEYSKTIEDYATPNEEDFMLHMTSGIIHSAGRPKAYNVTAYVLKNDKQEIRLHGYASVNEYEVHVNNETGLESYEQVDGTFYYFDVIKD